MNSSNLLLRDRRPLLFNQEGGVWNHFLAFLRKKVKTQKIMLTLDASKDRYQILYCYPTGRGDVSFLWVTSGTDLIDMSFCYIA